MSELDVKKKEVEYRRAELHLMESELRLMEALATVERLEAQIVAQKEKLEEIKTTQ